jgi:subtilisin family serine protease
MKTKLLAFLSPLVFTILAIPHSYGQEPAFVANRAKAAFRQDRVIVKFKERMAAASSELQSEAGTKTFRTFAFQPRLEVDVITGGQSVAEVIQKYKSNSAVEYAEPDYIVHALDEEPQSPNDPQFGKLWGLHNTGGDQCVKDADIHAIEAWKTRHDAPDVIVAVIDSGVRYTHEDLRDNMWHNPGESGGGKETNGKDDDGDGLIDDVYGINATVHHQAPDGTDTGEAPQTTDEEKRAGNPMDDNGHGTHCAGTIGAVGNNGKGIVGVAWKVQIMACKFLDSTGSGYTSDAIACINYARAKGAHIMSNSWGGNGFSQSLQEAIAEANSKGIIFVAAASNDSRDNDVTPVYPACYALPNIVSVASTTCNDTLSSFSNFGKKTVHLAAPGSEILSTWFLNDSSYRTISGTSMATPHVAGALALMKAQFPTMSHTDLIAALLKAVDKPVSLKGKVISDGRLNLQKALSNAPAGGAQRTP